jgi:hypothetical protein
MQLRPSRQEFAQAGLGEEVHRLARLPGHITRLELARGRPASAQRPVLQRVDVEQEQAARADKPPNLRDAARVTASGNMCRATLGHDRIEACIGEGKPPGHAGHLNLAIEADLACACPIASPGRSIAVTE